jgi:hypothetical protein
MCLAETQNRKAPVGVSATTNCCPVGLATSLQQRGESISQSWLGSELVAPGRGDRRPEGAAVSRRPADPAVVKTLEGSGPLDAGRKLWIRKGRQAHEGILGASRGPLQGGHP